MESNHADLVFKIQCIDNQLKIVPTEQEVTDKRRAITEQLLQRMEENYFKSGLAFRSMPFEEKQKLIRLIFGGEDEVGKKYGVFTKPVDGSPRKVQIRGAWQVGAVSTGGPQGKNPIHAIVNKFGTRTYGN